MFLIPAASQASSVQCPNLQGKFFCKGVEGSHKDMIMTIKQQLRPGYMYFAYTYAQVGQKPFTLEFKANDQGIKNNPPNDDVGRCILGYYFNSKDGRLTEKSLLNYLNYKGDYVVRPYKSSEPFLVCPRQ